VQLMNCPCGADDEITVGKGPLQTCICLGCGSFISKAGFHQPNTWSKSFLVPTISNRQVSLKIGNKEKLHAVN